MLPPNPPSKEIFSSNGGVNSGILADADGFPLQSARDEGIFKFSSNTNNDVSIGPDESSSWTSSKSTSSSRAWGTKDEEMVAGGNLHVHHLKIHLNDVHHLPPANTLTLRPCPGIPQIEPSIPCQVYHIICQFVHLPSRLIKAIGEILIWKGGIRVWGWYPTPSQISQP